MKGGKTMGDQNFNFGSIQGDIIAPGASGIVAKNISGNIHIGSEKLDRMPNEYSRIMEAFSENINLLLQKYQVEPEQIAPVQKKIDELADEITEVGPEAEVDYEKEISLKSKLVSAAAGLARLLPKGAEVVAAFSPLAPFSKLIGEAVDVVVQNVVKS